MFSNGVLTPALICDTHNKYIDWLTNERANMLIDQLGLPVKTWTDKKKKKK